MQKIRQAVGKHNVKILKATKSFKQKQKLGNNHNHGRFRTHRWPTPDCALHCHGVGVVEVGVMWLDLN